MIQVILPRGMSRKRQQVLVDVLNEQVAGLLPDSTERFWFELK